ncbi:hypothetical protein VTP01DRAFT_6699 [Rhizomucor pusillus]|uniref:uncharacterized protein n=1 Tax=Rhizomucor pusillus TaxID=4840 RepID=UPI003743635D
MMLFKTLSLVAIAGVSLAAPASSSPSPTSSSVTSSHFFSSSSSSSYSAGPSHSSSGNSTSSGGNGGGGDVTVTVKNNCGSGLKVYKLTNSAGKQESTNVGAGSSHDFQVDSNWSGRFWGCKDGNDCGNYGSAVSLAEFLFKGYGGQDFYDISFVDGFNLPLDISPEGGEGDCGHPSCPSLPSCPKELQTDGGACKSACAAFNNDEYCCRGEYNSPEKCKASEYADKFKSGCKDAYSYAYDDKTSTFGCKAHKYTVTFCPNGGGSGGGNH